MSRRQSDADETPVNGRAGEDGDTLARGLDRLCQLMEQRIAPALERIALALEAGGGLSAGRGVAAPAAEELGRDEQLRRAVAAGRWADAEQLVETTAEGELGDPMVLQAWRERIAEGKAQAAEQLGARLAASRKVNDTEAVLSLFDQLTPLLPRGEQGALERDVLQWLMALIMRRMRTGTVRSDVVLLAERVGERFGHTAEGASLRASLPVLRRSSDLCPKCGKPYAGLEDACPDCTGRPALADEPGEPAEEGAGEAGTESPV